MQCGSLRGEDLERGRGLESLLGGGDWAQSVSGQGLAECSVSESVSSQLPCMLANLRNIKRYKFNDRGKRKTETYIT